MKIILIFIAAIFFLGCNQTQKKSNTMNEIIKIEETVTKLFVNTDQKNWEGVENQFAEKVTLDYSSMNGNPVAELTPAEITKGWKNILPGFNHTHHQIGNFITKMDEDKADVFCYGTATHYLENEEGNVWTVIGSYNFQIVNKKDKWQISKMKFNFKYQDGNLNLIKKAIERASKK